MLLLDKEMRIEILTRKNGSIIIVLYNAGLFFGGVSMSNYPAAALGLKIMFWAEIISIAASLFSAIPLIGIVGSSVSVVCFVVTILGVYIAGRDDEGFKKAFILTIIALASSLVSLVFGFIPFIGEFLSSIMGVIAAVFGLIVKFYIITTIAGILRSVGEDAVADKGKTVWIIVMICTAADAVISLLVLIPALKIMADLLTAVFAAVEIVGSVLYLIYLYNSYKALGA